MSKPVKRRGESADFALSTHQVEEVLKACMDLDERVTISLQLFLGLRASEAVHMNANWITEQGDLKIPMQMTCNCAECMRQRGGTWRPKTKAGARTLPIPKRLRKDLSELLHLKPYGLGVSRVGLYYRTKTVLLRAKVRFQGLSSNTGFPHCLRATCFNMLAQGGLSAVGLAYFAGWSNIAVASHYISVIQARGAALKGAREIFG